MTITSAGPGSGGAPEPGSTRREELLRIAARLFAERGLRATTVRDIADAAGILSGSLYHHFASKEAIVDEILRRFLDPLFADYRRIVAAGSDPRSTLEQLVRVSISAIHDYRDEVEIYQDEVKVLRGRERFAYLRERNTEFRDMWMSVLQQGIDSGVFRSDLDVRLTYRFLRDTVWVAVRWYRPGSGTTYDTIADQYLHIVLDGLTVD